MGTRWPRRILLVLLLVLGIVVGGWFLALPRIAGAFTHEPRELDSGLSANARELVHRAFEGIDPARLVDYHTHLVGLGTGGSGCFVSPTMRSWWHVTKRVRFDVYLHASRITDPGNADAQYVARLVDLASNIPRPGRYLLLAFDRNYREDGSYDPDRTEFFVPNGYARRVAAVRPDLFVAALSVHPYRKDAVEELEQGAALGARIVKWLPNAMGIDPMSPLCDRFYDRMRELGVALLSHGGAELAVETPGSQTLGNPLRLRRALDHGAKVIVAHCASLGEDEDLDDPAGARRSHLDYFLRMMAEKRYEGLLFGEVSALTQWNRLPEALARILGATDIHARLVNGSDYPLPAINIIIRTGELAAGGFLSAGERDALNEIYGYNPLLFDFVTKRTVHLPGGGAGFPESVFLEHPALPVSAHAR